MPPNVRITSLLELKKPSQANSCTQPAVPIGPPGGAPRAPPSFPQRAVLRLLPTRQTIVQQYARFHRRIPLLDGALGDRAYVATAGLQTFVRTQQRRRACAQSHRVQDEG